MRQFLVSGKAQSVINLVTGLYSIIGMMVLFIVGNVAPLWCGVSTLFTLITFLVYNIWVSMELDKKRRERTF